MNTESRAGDRQATPAAKRAIKPQVGLAVLVWIVLVVVFGTLYNISRNTIIQEVRSQVMGVAIAVANGIDADAIAGIQTVEDMQTPAYLQIQDYLTNVSKINPDVRFIYTMRRSEKPGALPHEYEYVVDEHAHDKNEDGIICEQETGEDTGTPYDASDLPEMIAAWLRPAADYEITPDPPYPDLLSGYAPIKNAAGETVAIVGVDMAASTVREKLTAIRVALATGFLLLGGLVSCSLHLLNKTRRALERNRALTLELEDRNGMLRSANQELMRLNQLYEDELKLAQTVQRGFLPQAFPLHRELHFDKCFITCAMLGGDLYDVFSIDEQKIALYVADVAGHGSSAALISGLLKMAMESIKFGHAGQVEGTRAELLSSPARALKAVNELIMKEMPGDKFVTILYAVFDVAAGQCIIGSAGHPPPIIYHAGTAEPEICTVLNGPAVGLIASATFQNSVIPVKPGDKMLFYTDGLTEAMDSNHEEFGEKRLVSLVAELGRKGCENWAESITAAVTEHRGPCEISDDFTLLVTDFSGIRHQGSQNV